MIQSTHVRKNKNEAKSLRQGTLYLTVAECTPVVVLVGYFEALGGEQFIFQQFIFLHKYIYGQQINLWVLNSGGAPKIYKSIKNFVHPLADVFYGIYYVIKRWKISASYPDYMIVSTRKLAPSSSKVTGIKKQSGMFCRSK